MLVPISVYLYPRSAPALTYRTLFIAAFVIMLYSDPETYTFEDGRTGAISANLKIIEAETYDASDLLKKAS